MELHPHNSIHRALMPLAGALLLASIIANLSYARRNVILHLEVERSGAKLQELNQSQQQINLIAQDLVSLSPQYPWMKPILQKYGLLQAPQNPPPASSLGPQTRQAGERNP